MMNYKQYIVSSEWRSKHPQFLRQSRYRCAMFPFVKVGKKARYNVHHMTYQNLGNERLWVDVVCLCPFAHSFIIHGILSGFKRPSQQKIYPNTAQQIAHVWCCQPVILRGALIVAVILNLIKLAYL